MNMTPKIFEHRDRVSVMRQLQQLKWEPDSILRVNKIFECPKCCQVFGKTLRTSNMSLYSCMRGHLVCGACYGKFKTDDRSCPTCQTKNWITKTSVSKLNDLRRTTLKCCNKSFGCEFKSYRPTTWEHEESCLYRPVTCTSDGCSTKLPIRLGLWEHIMKEHTADVIHDSRAILEDKVLITDYVWPVKFFLIGNHAPISFHLKCGPDNTIMIWCRSQESTNKNIKPALNFSVELHKATLSEKVSHVITSGEEDISIRTLSLDILGVSFDSETYETDKMLSLTVQIELLEDTSKGCKHHERMCQIVCPYKYCKRAFGCRICHDRAVDSHKLNRFNVEEVVCRACGTRQEISACCKKCETKFANSYCRTCCFFDDENVQQKSFQCYECAKGSKRSRQSGIECSGCGLFLEGGAHFCNNSRIKIFCTFCHEVTSHDRVHMACSHYLHKFCHQKWLQIGSNRCCSMCYERKLARGIKE